MLLHIYFVFWHMMFIFKETKSVPRANKWVIFTLLFKDNTNYVVETCWFSWAKASDVHTQLCWDSDILVFTKTLCCSGLQLQLLLVYWNVIYKKAFIACGFNLSTETKLAVWKICTTNLVLNSLTYLMPCFDTAIKNITLSLKSQLVNSQVSHSL